MNNRPHNLLTNIDWISILLYTILVLMGWLNIYRNALQGMGEAFVPLMGGVMELVMRVVVAAVAAPFGFWAVCFASPMAWLGADIPLLFTYRRRIRALCPPKKEEENAVQKETKLI